MAVRLKGAGGRPFYQRINVPVPHQMDELARLELYQAYPHDPFSTLCLGHLLPLAEDWHRRRAGQSGLKHEPAATAGFDVDAGSINPAMLDTTAGTSDDAEQLSLQAVRQADEWRRCDAGDQVRELAGVIDEAAARLRKERRAAIACTSEAPRCGLGFQGGALLCVLCAAADAGLDGLLSLMRQRILGGDHGALSTDEALLADEGRRLRDEMPLFTSGCGHAASSIEGDDGDGEGHVSCRVCDDDDDDDDEPPTIWADEVSPSGAQDEAPANHTAHVSVGGLHLVVDICEGITLVKFQYGGELDGTAAVSQSSHCLYRRSTVFSTVHERGRLGRLGADRVCAWLADEIGAFEPTTCSAARRPCACRP